MSTFKLDLLRQNAHVHFIGIGGISMSGLAEILIKDGYIISGSDIKKSTLTEKLENLGAKIYIGHCKENIKKADLIVYTAAIDKSNPEIIEAIRLNKPLIERPVLLGEIMKGYTNSIAVAGTHGKTTTTSMISCILLHSKLDPTVLIGGELEAIGGNVRVGKSDYFITEACEYVESFLKFHPSIGLILNVETDHLDFFKNIDHIIRTFNKFAKLIPEDGYTIVCGDNKNALESIIGAKSTIITYGLTNENSNWQAKNIEFNIHGLPCFDIIFNGEFIANLNLSVPGIHNVYNALASIACAYSLNINMADILKGLTLYHGTGRRFEIKGKLNGYTIIDDYAHHPTEIKITLEAAHRIPHNKLWCIFQPHTYTRTLALLDDFTEAFSFADQVIITDIYAAREKDNGKIHSKVLADRIRQKGISANYIQNFDDIKSYILKHASKEDIIITMGAGNVFEIGESLLKISS